jgi:hypothetical protein
MPTVRKLRRFGGSSARIVQFECKVGLRFKLLILDGLTDLPGGRRWVGMCSGIWQTRQARNERMNNFLLGRQSRAWARCSSGTTGCNSISNIRLYFEPFTDTAKSTLARNSRIRELCAGDRWLILCDWPAAFDRSIVRCWTNLSSKIPDFRT